VFDIVVDSSLLYRASSDFVIDSIALDSLQSFLTGRTQCVGVGSSCSKDVACMSGVPQGSVLRPLLITIYTSPISNVVSARSLCYHQYDDDTTIFVALQPGSDTFAVMSACVDDVAQWFLENGMLLNPTKTDTMLCGTHAQRQKVNVSSGSTSPGYMSRSAVPSSCLVSSLIVHYRWTVMSTLMWFGDATTTSAHCDTYDRCWT